MPSTRLRVRRAATAVALAVGAAAVGACSADEGTTEAATEPQPAISIDSGLVMSDGDGDGPAPSPQISKTCLELQEAWAETNRSLAAIDETHPRVLVTGFREAQRAFTSVDAPEDVDGWTEMGDYLDAAVGALADVDSDDADEVASVMTLTFSEADTVQAATAHAQITEYVESGCRG
ncbi:hypothetical protein [Isoptericola aurantiacus]|uniref:hypothetical protein n=1 Tax=Isoptericola aurantiacus TaxID=3377839 RepID=UPI00383B6A20